MKKEWCERRERPALQSQDAPTVNVNVNAGSEQHTNARHDRHDELASIARQFERIKAEMHGKQIAIHNERFCCELPCGCEDKFKIIAIRRDDAPMSCAQLHSERSSSFTLAHNRCKIHTFGFRISFIDIRVRAHTATKYQPARMCRWNCTQMGPSLWPIRL